MKLQAENEVAEVVARINYVLIDYENVQPESLAQLERPEFRVIVFVGANQTRIPFDVAASLQRMGRHARRAAFQGGRVVLDPVGVAHFPHHIDVVIGSLFQPLGFQ